MSKAVAELGLALASGEPQKIRNASNVVENRLFPIHDIFSNPAWNSLFPKPQSPPDRSPKPTKGRAAASTGGISTPQQKHALGKIFGGGTFTLDPQLCFVLMPFAAKLQPIFEDHIRPTVQKAGLRCERADDIVGVQLITRDIWERINRARFIVADLTDLNANVFYELGLAHALSKDVILLTQSMDFVPFDLKPLRCIVYEPDHRGGQKLESVLAATIGAIMKAG